MNIPGQQHLFTGMGGWELDASGSCFYPPKPKKGFRKLEYYSQFFNSVEVNSTFYNNSLSPIHARQWLGDVGGNKEFLFTVKLFQGFTHNLTATNDDVRTTCRLLDTLAEAGKLGGALLQFPYHFTNLKERRQYLMQLGKIFGQYRLFVEMRHNSWLNPMMFPFLQENKIHWVNSDRPAANNTIPFTCVAWDDVAYFRMMGRGSAPIKQRSSYEQQQEQAPTGPEYYYSQKEMEHLYYVATHRVKASTVFAFFHNDPVSNALINGFQLQHLAKNKQKVLAPQNLIATYPPLKEISVSVNVLHPLFAGEGPHETHKTNIAA